MEFSLAMFSYLKWNLNRYWRYLFCFVLFGDFSGGERMELC